MADFTSAFWSWFIVIVTIGGIVALVALIVWQSIVPPGETEAETMGHVWDGDLAELNNPLPRWWLHLFYITIFFSVGYLVWYPGLGTFSGMLNWTQVDQYDAEVAEAEARYAPLYEKFTGQSITDLISDPKALKMGERLYAAYCTGCHGSDARGVTGFPNLRDQDWLYGGDPAAIKATILKGRNGVMPPWKDALGGDEGVRNVSQYVLSLSGREVDGKAAAAGEQSYKSLCVACHMPDGTGNTALGAPNLTDNIWLYGGSPKTVEATIANGRSGQMPAHEEFLGEAKTHVLAAYIYSLSR